MNIGRFRIEQLSEGFFEVFKDGSLVKADPERSKNIEDVATSRSRSTVIGVDPVYITDNNVHILLDTGLGWGLDFKSEYTQSSNVETNLEIFDVHPDDVQFVVLSHLHYDHCAGSTHVNEHFQTKATFPNAQYIIHEKEWTHALNKIDQQDSIPGAEYKLDEMYKLIAEQRIHFIQDEIYEVVPGVELILSGGHTPGHQIVRIQDELDTAYYLGDLVPTESHLNYYSMKQMDENPIQSKKVKTLLLREAYQAGATLLFYHSLFKKSGKLAIDQDKKYVLLED